MIISATGIVFDHFGDVLLIQRNDTRTLAPPGGAAEIDELPPQTAVREVKEETGLIIMPVRLVGIYYLPTKPNDFLTFCYRCIIRGGKIETSAESPRAGFFNTKPYPKPMLPFSKERIQRSREHRGGPPYWGNHQLSASMKIGNLFLNSVVYPWFNFQRKLTKKPPHIPPPNWQVTVRLIVRDKHQRVLWIKDPNDNSWRLPEGASFAKEPPWITATRVMKETIGIPVTLSDIKEIYVFKGKPEMLLIFEAELSIKVPEILNDRAGMFMPAEEPANSIVHHNQNLMRHDHNGIHYQLIEE